MTNARKNKGIGSPVAFQSAELIVGRYRRSKPQRYLAMVTGIPMIGQTMATKMPNTTIKTTLAMIP